MICLFESSTRFEQRCAYPQEDICINHSVLVAIRYAGQDGSSILTCIPDGH